MRNIMLDLETFATDWRAAIASIGAVVFDIQTGEIGNTFKINISFWSNWLNGRTINNGTLNWWANQSEEAQAALADPASTNFITGIHEFAAWVQAQHKDPLVWGNGVLFDNLIIRTAFQDVGIPCPWHFRNDRDVRTLVAMGKQFGENAKNNSSREGLVHHDPLSDCIYQVRYCSSIWRHLKSETNKL